MTSKFQMLEIIHESEDRVTVIKKMKDNENDRFIILKEINGMDHITKLFFEREVNALKKLNNHPNIVKMYDYEIVKSGIGEGDIGRIYLEHIRGQDLSKVNLGIIENTNKYNIIYEFIDAIEIAHSKGIIHRDIKPSNIMVENYQHIKLIDFGISKIKGMITGGTVGTVANFATNKYTAPEVCYHSENASFKSDIYSIGATIYFLMTGNEPPLPGEFSKVVLETSGINLKLKDIICKSVKSNPEERYDSVTDIKRELELILKDLMRNSKFVVTIPDEIYLSAKHKKLIPNSMSKIEFINVRLNDWFKDAYAFIDTLLTGSKSLNQEHSVVIFGGKYKLVCTYKDYDEYLVVSELIPVDSKVRNELTNTYMKVNGVLNFYSSTNFKIDEIENKTNELANDLIDHRIKYQSDTNKQTKFDKFFGIWNDYLEAEKSLIRETATKIHYESCVYKDDGTIELELEDVRIEELDFNQETILILDDNSNNPNQKKSNIITVGTFYDYKFDGDKVFMILKKIKDSTKKIAKSPGVLVTDYKTLIYVIEKQLTALWILRKNECECNESLRDLILGFDKPSSIDSFNNLEFFNNEMDFNQREAVKRALCTSSVCVIQGPPGTGKTTVIREIVNQILKREQEDYGKRKYRILIVSQTHTAVDNILNGLIKSYNLNTKIVRMGCNNNNIINDDIWEKYSVENAHKTWINKTIENSNQRIMQLLNGYGVDLGEFKRYSSIKVKIGISEIKADDSKYIFDFEDKYMKDKDKERIINTALIQNEWTSGLYLARDSEMRLIESATIVAGTCTGFNSNPIVKNMSFDYVIIDEAAKATVPELIVPLLKGSRFILVGDQNQLPPMLKDKVIKRCEGLDKKELENGLFEHLYKSFPPANRIKLSMQYRMHETIGNMISNVFYKGEIETGVKNSEREHKLEYYKNKSIVWESTSNFPYDKRIDEPLKGGTFKNYEEVKVIKHILQNIDREEVAKDYEIAVITGYRGQKNSIIDEINRMDFKNIKDIEVNTVDAYQGRDKDIVIFSTVRSNDRNDIGFQKSQNRINVAFSRARRLIVIVGDHEHFYNNKYPTNSFPRIIDYIKKNEGCSLKYLEVNYGRK